MAATAATGFLVAFCTSVDFLFEALFAGGFALSAVDPLAGVILGANIAEVWSLTYYFSQLRWIICLFQCHILLKSLLGWLEGW